MRHPSLQERRNRQILADIVRTYIETGEPVSSRAVSKRFDESLSTATIRNFSRSQPFASRCYASRLAH